MPVVMSIHFFVHVHRESRKPQQTIVWHDIKYNDSTTANPRAAVGIVSGKGDLQQCMFVSWYLPYLL